MKSSISEIIFRGLRASYSGIGRDALTSMRNLALELRISFMTTKRAYEQLEEDGFTLDNISFDVPRGSILGFIGQNGAGKTTTIRSLLNITKIDGGEIKLLGMDHIRDELCNYIQKTGRSFWLRDTHWQAQISRNQSGDRVQAHVGRHDSMLHLNLKGHIKYYIIAVFIMALISIPEGVFTTLVFGHGDWSAIGRGYVWHAELTVEGHNFGTDYPGYPFEGIGMMCLICTFEGMILMWLTKRSGSICNVGRDLKAEFGIACFNVAEMRDRYAHLLCKLLLGELAGFSIFADALSNLIII